MYKNAIVKIKRRRGPYRLLISASFRDEEYGLCWLSELPPTTVYKVLKTEVCSQYGNPVCLLIPVLCKSKVYGGTWVESIHLRPVTISKGKKC